MMIYHERSGMARRKIATPKEALLFYGFIGLLNTLFELAMAGDEEFRKAVRANGRLVYSFHCKNMSGHVRLNAWQFWREKKRYGMDMTDIEGTLKHLLESPKNILDLMMKGVVKTDPEENPVHLFNLGYLFSVIEPKASEFLKLLNGKNGKEKIETKKPSKPKLNENASRVERLTHEARTAEPAISIENAELSTDFFKKNLKKGWFMTELWARTLRYVLSHMTIVIFEDELIPGSVTEHRMGAGIWPWLFSHALLPDLKGLSTRNHNPMLTTAEQIHKLVTKIYPYWEDKTVYWQAKKDCNNGNRKSFRLTEKLAFYLSSLSQMISHIVPNYEMVLKKGLIKMIEEARAREQKELERGNQEKAAFFRAKAISMEGVSILAKRYARECAHLAKEADTKRAKELLEMSAILQQVPDRPAETLHEALIAINMLRVALNQENFCSGLSIGPLDKLLHPYYQADLKAKRTSRARTRELVACFLIKLNDHVPSVPDSAQYFLGGTPPNQAVTTGGIDRNGQLAIYEITFIILEATAQVSLREPNLCVRIPDPEGWSDFYQKRIRKLIREALKVSHKTGASLAFYSDKAIIPELRKVNPRMSQEDANDYSIVGCVEPTGTGNTMGHTGSIMFNLAPIIELAIFGGVHPLSGQQVGRETIPLGKCRNFRDFWKSFEVQLGHIARNATVGGFWLGRAHEEIRPTPLLSAVISGTDESGRDVTAGGAKYNSSGVGVIGFSDVVDSLIAIKEAFRTKKFSPQELEDAVRNNFQDPGQNKIRAWLSNKAPKFGKDDSAQEIALQLHKLLDNIFQSSLDSRGGVHLIGYWSMSMHAGMGGMVGALPSGRLAGESLSSGLTPAHRGTKDGPTAILNRTAEICAPNGSAVNLLLDPRNFDTPEQLEKVTGLVWTYLNVSGGMQVQITVHDRAILMAAMKNPELYPYLIVRVSGYNSYFTDLTKKAQLELVGRPDMPAMTR